MASNIPDFMAGNADGDHHAAAPAPSNQTGAVEQIPLALIDEPAAPHRASIAIDELAALIESIRTDGILAPLVVRRSGPRFEVIAGHRRLLAARTLTLPTAPCIIREDSDEISTHRVRAAENLIRVALSPLEEARICHDLQQSTGWDIDQLAKHLTRTRYWVEQRLALAQLPGELALMVEQGDLPAGHALALATVEDENHRTELASHCARGGATLQVLRGWIDSYRLARSEGLNPPPVMYVADPNTGRHVALYNCPGCQENVPYTQTTLLRICNPCSSAIIEGMPCPPEPAATQTPASFYYSPALVPRTEEATSSPHNSGSSNISDQSTADT